MFRWRRGYIRACLIQKAWDAKDEAIQANQKELLCWCFYIVEFDKKTIEFTIKSLLNIGFTDEPQDEEQNNALEVQVNLLELAKASISTTPIPLTHISNSSVESQIKEVKYGMMKEIIMKMMTRMMMKDVIMKIKDITIMMEDIKEKSRSPMTSLTNSLVYA
ncbi:hypothetical protein RclHR1_02590008 [Rhizophagus clarus]|uniref:Uncharacterized protein n=1 Tax=Rhizophagus clarus TaxID=94130 RepID=A0A2Z6QZR5_9GLOM|nr:hypothetical protein RclHR1_02590008 [Rhizophagus clarus]